jgi:hypothetical protein
MGKEEINITDSVSSIKIKIEDEDMKPLNQVSEKLELQLSALKKILKTLNFEKSTDT